MNLETWADGKPILAEFSRLNTLLKEENYTAAVKADILDSLNNLGLKKSDESKFVILRQNHGHLVKRPKTGPPQIIADGRDDWIGWLELKTEAVNEVATQMTARVVKEVNADILAVIEAEDRPSLLHFNDQLLQPSGAEYAQVMLIDGNDERGIDVGLLTRPGFQIGSMVSHVDEFADNGERIFSRDCPEFTIRVGTKTLLILVNHLKSKGFGTPAKSNARRLAQAQRVRAIYDQRRAEGIEFIAVVGDFNDNPSSDPLKPLLANGSELRDITTHAAFTSDGRPGTFGNGTASNKIDYILLSPALFNRVTSGQIFRKGVWGGVHGTLFPHFDEMTKAIHAASDHAAIVADFDL